MFKTEQLKEFGGKFMLYNKGKLKLNKEIPINNIFLSFPFLFFENFTFFSFQM